MPSAEHTFRERETKLSPPPGFRLPDLHGVADGVSPAPAATQQLHATYYDTADLRLARAGASLRHRDDEGWTVKLPTDANGALVVRDEHHFSGDPQTPPAPAVDLVAALTRTEPLQPVGQLRTLRRRIELRGGDGALAEVTDDDVTVLDGTRVTTRFREVEVELRADAPEELASSVVERLREAGAGDPDPTPKIVRALGPRAQEPPDVVPAPKLDQDVEIGDVVRAAITTAVRRLMAHDPGVRLGSDPEAVHQARVATRRLRSDLHTFGEVLEPEWTDRLRDELKWIAGHLGAVRDTEVLIDRLDAKAHTLTGDDRPIAERVVSRLRAHRASARAELVDAMRSDRYIALLDRLVQAAVAPVLVAAAADPARDVLPRLVRRPWDKLAAAVDDLGDDPPDEDLHGVRKRAKQCRYAAEAAVPVIGKPAARFAEAVEAVQEVLGEHQDAVTAELWLRDARKVAPAPETFVLGELAGLERVDAARSREQWPDTWRSARRKRLRSWL